MKKFSKILGINLLIFALFLLIPAVLFDLYKRYKLSLEPPAPSEDLAINPAYPSLEDREKAEQMASQKEAGIEYKAFIGWRRNAYSGELKNVVPPYNNRLSFNSTPDDSVWFFGGSTMWGSGSIDMETIPSWYAKKTGLPVFNLGESAWVSRQSLNQLLNLLGDGKVPKKVIFYDGVNDILHGCRSTNPSVPSHQQEDGISKLVKRSDLDFLNSKIMPLKNFIVAPYKAIAAKLGINVERHKNYGGMDCSLNPAKAQLVADHLLYNWYSAYLLSAAAGSDFMAVLQPQVFSTQGIDKSYLHSGDSYMSPEYAAVYPLIKDKMNEYCDVDLLFCSKIFDGTSWLDGRDPVYTDFCHLTGKGNGIIADEIIKSESL